MKFKHFLQRKVATHIGIHDKEQVGIPRQYLVAEVVHATGCAQRTVLLQISAQQQNFLF